MIYCVLHPATFLLISSLQEFAIKIRAAVDSCGRGVCFTSPYCLGGAKWHVSSGSAECSKCKVDGCDVCDFGFGCDACRDGFGLTPDRSCEACATACKRCTGAGVDGCAECIPGFGWDAGRCFSCADQCESCAQNGPGQCDPGHCSTGWMLKNVTDLGSICVRNRADRADLTRGQWFRTCKKMVLRTICKYMTLFLSLPLISPITESYQIEIHRLWKMAISIVFHYKPDCWRPFWLPRLLKLFWGRRSLLHNVAAGGMIGAWGVQQGLLGVPLLHGKKDILQTSLGIGLMLRSTCTKLRFASPAFFFRVCPNVRTHQLIRSN